MFKNDSSKQYKNQLRGARNRATGDIFEKLIEASCIYYDVKKLAVIEKTPEPMRVIKNLGNGRFEAHFEKKAQPDFKGTLHSGKTIVFEAKHTDADRIEYDRLTDKQIEGLNKYSAMNAICYVLVTIKMQTFYFVPWVIWQNMKKLCGRKYMTVEDLKPYEVHYFNGVIRFLNDFEVKGEKAI